MLGKVYCKPLTFRGGSDDSHELRQELMRKEEIIDRLQSDLEHVQLQRVSLEKVLFLFGYRTEFLSFKVAQM